MNHTIIIIVVNILANLEVTNETTVAMVNLYEPEKDVEIKKLKVTFCNYLLLHHFELARAVLHQLASMDANQAVSLLQQVLLKPQSIKGLFTTPRLMWFCFTEYRHLKQVSCSCVGQPELEK